MQHHGWVGCRQPKRQLPRVLAAWQTHQHKVMLCVSCIPFALHPPAVRLSAAGKGVLVVAYNPLAWSREVPLRVPLNTSKTCGWKVTGQLGGAAGAVAHVVERQGRQGVAGTGLALDFWAANLVAVSAVDYPYAFGRCSAGPEGEEVASELVGVAPGTWCVQQLLADVNATCPTTFADGGGWVGQRPACSWCARPVLVTNGSSCHALVFGERCSANGAPLTVTLPLPRRAGLHRPPTAPGLQQLLPGAPARLILHSQHRRQHRCQAQLPWRAEQRQQQQQQHQGQHQWQQGRKGGED